MLRMRCLSCALDIHGAPHFAVLWNDHRTRSNTFRPLLPALFSTVLPELLDAMAGFL